MDIKIRSPQGQKVNLSGVIKQLLDGIISAFHEQDGLLDPVAIKRLVALLGKNSREIEDLLYDSESAVLGKRKSIHPFRKGIQWNPADDLRTAIKVSLEDSLDGQKWLISGELFSVVQQIPELNI
jgi:hypothetical protein